MKCLVSASARFAVTQDGILWTPNPSLKYSFWARYLDVYDEVRMLVRAKPCVAPPDGWLRASGDGIRATPLGYFEGPLQFAVQLPRIRQRIRQALREDWAIQLRLPCAIGSEVWRILSPNRPYGVEVVGDPYDVFAPGAVRHPLRPFFRWWSPRRLRRKCAGACAAAYVSEHALQSRYPAAPHAFTTHYSSIELPQEAIVNAPRHGQLTEPIWIVSVGTLAQLYKAPDVLIDAVALCVEQGLDLQAVWLGDGKHKAELEEYAAQRGVAEQVGFVGQVPAGEAVRAQLDQADLFVLPSRTEGLPKVIIEAMARALPCIGTNVGGIPELLPPEDLVPAGDAKALAQKIKKVVTDPKRMARMSARNLEKAREYQDHVLRERRIAFYQYVRDRTEEWLKERARRQQPS